MNNIKKVFAIGCIFLILLFSAGCGKQKITQEETITVGFISPLTGDVANYGESARGGVELALEEINAQGINGKKMNVIYEDGRCNAKDATLAAQKLINQNGVYVIMGGVCSSETLAAAPLAEEAQVVLVSFASSSPDITNSGDYIFRTWPSDAGQGKKIAEKMIADGIKTVGIVHPNSDYNLALAKAFTESFEAQGGKVVLREMYEQDAKDFRTQLLKVKAAQVEAMYIIPYGEGGLVMKQAREQGISVPLYASETVGTPEVVADAGGAAEGVIYATPAFDAESSSAKVFLEKYVSKYGKEPSFGVVAATAYDTAHLVADALRTGEDANAVKQYLYNVQNYAGVAGTLTIDEHGDALKDFQLMVIHEGAFIPLEKLPKVTLSNKVMIKQNDESLDVTPVQVKAGEVQFTIENTDTIKIVTGIEGNGLDNVYETESKKKTEISLELQPGDYLIYDALGSRKNQGRFAPLEVLA
ncbi:penicillin-binding protein activator [Candidatus Woesearchaeota archaeon]|nr:penicillin-binding protein activator [Candidatus Woesearchaeota archaeon]